MGDLYDAPNQQVVRPDGSAPWDEGEGGGEGAAPEPQAQRTSSSRNSRAAAGAAGSAQAGSAAAARDRRSLAVAYATVDELARRLGLASPSADQLTQAQQALDAAGR